MQDTSKDISYSKLYKNIHKNIPEGCDFKILIQFSVNLLIKALTSFHLLLETKDRINIKVSIETFHDPHTCLKYSVIHIP